MADDGITKLNPVALLRMGMAAVPAVRYAMGLVGVSAAIFLIRALLPGVSFQAMLPLLLGTIVAMAVLLIFAASAASPRSRQSAIGLFFLWAACLFIVMFMVFTVTAVALGWPSSWARLILPQSAAETSLVDATTPAKDRTGPEAPVKEGPAVVGTAHSSEPPHSVPSEVTTSAGQAAVPPKAVPRNAAEDAPRRPRKFVSMEDRTIMIFFDYLGREAPESAAPLLANVVSLCVRDNPDMIRVASHIDGAEAAQSEGTSVDHSRLSGVVQFIQRSACNAPIEAWTEGFDRPPVITPRGKREPQNRFVSVEFFKATN